MSLQAYQTATARAETPKQAEYRLFGQVTRALMDAATMPDDQIAGRVEALDWNRRLWSTLATDCADPGNSMPMPLRAQIISISMWVSRHTSAVIRREEEIEPLIDINRIIMQGLHGGAEAA